MGDIFKVQGLSEIDIQRKLATSEGVNKVLHDFGNEIQEALKQNLDSRQSQGTSQALRQSIRFEIENARSPFIFELNLNDYYKFQDQGVRGVGGSKKDGTMYTLKSPNSPFSYKDKKPKLTSEGLEFWSYAKNLNPFFVQERIYRRGIKATNFYSDVVNEQRINKLIQDLKKAMKQEGIAVVKLIGDGFKLKGSTNV